MVLYNWTERIRPLCKKTAVVSCHRCLKHIGVEKINNTWIYTMFVERKVCYSALFTNLVRWHAGAVSFPLSDVILAQLACPLSDVMFCLHLGITNLSLYKHWIYIRISTTSGMYHKHNTIINDDASVISK